MYERSPAESEGCQAIWDAGFMEGHSLGPGTCRLAVAVTGAEGCDGPWLSILLNMNPNILVSYVFGIRKKKKYGKLLILCALFIQGKDCPVHKATGVETQDQTLGFPRLSQFFFNIAFGEILDI